VKTVARRQAPPKWFRVPSDTYFNPGAIESLRELGARQAVVVTDPEAEARGVADEVRRRLEGRAVHVFSELEPEPGDVTLEGPTPARYPTQLTSAARPHHPAATVAGGYRYGSQPKEQSTMTLFRARSRSASS
jgi:hypothetical protein